MIHTSKTQHLRYLTIFVGLQVSLFNTSAYANEAKTASDLSLHDLLVICPADEPSETCAVNLEEISTLLVAQADPDDVQESRTQRSRSAPRGRTSVQGRATVEAPKDTNNLDSIYSHGNAGAGSYRPWTADVTNISYSDESTGSGGTGSFSGAAADRSSGVTTAIVASLAHKTSPDRPDQPPSEPLTPPTPTPTPEQPEPTPTPEPTPEPPPSSGSN